MRLHNEGLFDCRKREGREQEILAELAISGGVAIAWIEAIPSRRAAWLRLVDSKRIKVLRERNEFITAQAVEQPERKSTWRAMVDSVLGAMA